MSSSSVIRSTRKFSCSFKSIPSLSSAGTISKELVSAILLGKPYLIVLKNIVPGILPQVGLEDLSDRSVSKNEVITRTV
jgi:hypothetical protein